MNLLVPGAMTRIQLWYPDLRHEFIGGQGSLEVPVEEVGRRDAPLARWAAHDQDSIEGHSHCREVPGCVTMGERTAERPAVPHLWIPDEARRLGQDGTVPSDERVGHYLMVGSGGPDDEVVTLFPNSSKFRDSRHVHEHVRVGKAQLHQW